MKCKKCKKDVTNTEIARTDVQTYLSKSGKETTYTYYGCRTCFPLGLFSTLPEEVRAKRRAAESKYRKGNAEFLRKKREKYATNKTFRAKCRARTAVFNALACGKATKGDCAICKSQENIQAHHNDHNKPLVVVWLCHKCHTKHHAGKISTEQLISYEKSMV